MFQKLVEFALTQRRLVLIATVFLIGAGVTAFRALPIDAFPAVSSTQVKIIVKAPAYSRSDKNYINLVV